MDLYDIHKIHKRTVLIKGNGFAVDCVLKQKAGHEGWPLRGVPSFVGVIFDESGKGYHGDSFELTLDVEDVNEVTDLIPDEGWFVKVKHPNFKDDENEFYIEYVDIDRTNGMYLLRCSASTTQGKGKSVDRNAAGAI